MQVNGKILFLLVFPLMLLSGCREDILPPEAFIGTKNSAVVDNFRSYYNLQIDAENLDMIISDSLKFRTNNAYIEILNFDYSAGNVDVSLFNGLSLLYVSSINSNKNNYKFSIEGQVPSRVTLRFSNFTGKFKIKLLPYN
ncbi:MAG: hypothetical protein HUU54_03160 [Ignavibacteriaceae bacterium]|nr:hypothetical protein [Ignavibacteriaceae bacterium]